ncbi:hypothetical protein P879_03341, partial [Paragonimus westermani]
SSKTSVELIRFVIHACECIWTISHNYNIGSDIAWSLAICLEALVAHKENVLAIDSQAVVDSDDALDLLKNLGVDWTKLLTICCELSSTETGKPIKDESVANFHPAALYSGRTVGDPEQVKHPIAHRCEQGAKTLGYLLRLLFPGMVKDHECLHRLIHTMCALVVMNKLCSSERIRWNANLAAGHLFQNPCVWELCLTEPSSDMVTLEPLNSPSTIAMFGELVERLAHTFAQDKYFKARVYAANSLLGMFHKLFKLSDCKAPGFPTVINQVRLRTEHALDRMIEFHILDASFSVLSRIEARDYELQSASTSATHEICRITKLGLTESQYRLQCLYSASCLLFYALTCLVTYINLHWTNCTNWIDQLNNRLSTWISREVQEKLIGLIGELHEPEKHATDDSFGFDLGKPMTRMMMVHQVLNFTNGTAQSEKLQTLCQRFQIAVNTLQRTVSSITLSKRHELLSQLTWLCSLCCHPGIQGSRCDLTHLMNNLVDSETDNLGVFKQIYD